MFNFFKKKGNVVVRMAPSPTGNLHIGTARTALFNYLFAKRYGGKFILRSEDTDKERSKEEYEDNIISGLHWLGMEWDEFYRQSERTGVYVSYIKKMLDNGTAYISKEEPKEEGQRGEVVRFKNPNKVVKFDDLIRGSIEIDTTDLGDFVIAKSPEEPLYHLAVVVDDHEMGVTHVIRGEDHISNTPRQILIQEAIGASRPVYGHLPLIFDANRQKLSKRKHGAMVWIDTYKEEGYLPDALLNFFALMGWNPGTEQEIFTLPELIKAFSIERVQKGAAVYNLEKLRWVNKEHIKRMNREEVSKLVHDKIERRFSLNGKWEKPENFQILADIVIERTEVFSDIDKMLEAGELDYFFSAPDLDKEKIAWKADSKENTIRHLERAKEIIESGEDLMKYAEEAGKGSVLWPVRYSLSGREKSPDPFTLLSALGPEESVRRIGRAIELLSLG
jgi:glutamyl-tRNA synthetase